MDILIILQKKQLRISKKSDSIVSALPDKITGPNFIMTAKITSLICMIKYNWPTTKFVLPAGVLLLIFYLKDLNRYKMDLPDSIIHYYEQQREALKFLSSFFKNQVCLLIMILITFGALSKIWIKILKFYGIPVW